MSSTIENCPCCNNQEAKTDRKSLHSWFVDCPICGKFQYHDRVLNDKANKDEYSSYCYYTNKHASAYDEFHYLYLGILEDYEKDYKTDSSCQFASVEEVKAFYPHKFTEKLDRILCEFAGDSSFIGDALEYTTEELTSLCFVNRYNKKSELISESDIDYQLEKILNYLKDYGYIGWYYTSNSNCEITLEPDGWKRVDEIQKNTENTSKTVFVAMSFAPDMADVREAIKKAIGEFGFIPRLMDEIEHNHQIVPEMLYEIREAKFVIAELTGHNNGAYFEAGYALGLGKEVIHVCNKEKFGEDGHFDVKQVNTILWETTEDLTNRLVARIKATIN